MKLIRMLKMLFIVLMLVCCAAPSSVLAGQGSVDWSSGFITSTGYGTAPRGMAPNKALLNARRAAEIDAQRALLETIKGIHIDTQTTIDGSLQRDVASRTRIEGVVRGALIVKQDVNMVDGSPVATVVMRLCLDGRSAECSGKGALVSAFGLDRFASQNDGRSTGSMPTFSSPREQAFFDRARPATATILLLSGQRFERVLLPVVVSVQKGESVLVYGVRRVAPEIVRTYGIVRYADSLEQARITETAGANPVIISAEAVTADNRIMIAPQDAATLEETLRYGNNYLEKGRVVIVR
ncbi:MAG TPA: hypothetical protein HPP94_05860 [Desulfuromonadales bacterium]|nr:hypothetical protein [Desulfuromonadales bacterium]